MKSLLIEKLRKDPYQYAFSFPWRFDSICLNFKWPDTCISINEIDDIKNKEEIEALVIGCNLLDYSFIEDLKNLQQLYIYKGKNIYNLDFIRNLTSLNQLYITNSNINSLDKLAELIKKQKNENDEGFYGICIDSDNDLDIMPLIEDGMDILEVNINRHNFSKMIA